MSIVEPKIDTLLESADLDRFLLCSVASKRATDINNMMRGQRDRAVQLSADIMVAQNIHKKALSMAFEEISRGEVSYDKATLKA
ncbi:MAG: DNA-directed RNA polymerase subunit omega [Eggerthellaceae bacterium]|nr:DNA-directed RNA polymerase subunit omega [Eggerthellaceae bacterium]